VGAVPYIIKRTCSHVLLHARPPLLPLPSHWSAETWARLQVGEEKAGKFTGKQVLLSMAGYDERKSYGRDASIYDIVSKVIWQLLIPIGATIINEELKPRKRQSCV
jgi:hypothetical protein